MAQPELPEWLIEAPEELQDALMVAYEECGDDLGAILNWIRQLQARPRSTYRQFWDRIDSDSDPLRTVDHAHWDQWVDDPRWADD